MVKVRMAGRDNEILVCMLQHGQLLSDLIGMMVVDQSDRAYNGGVWSCGQF